MLVLESVELTPPRLSTTAGGVRKLTSAPVLALITEGEVSAGTLFCEWVATHAGLEPGPYPLRNGVTVDIPSSLCSMDGRVAHSITLEVTHE